MKQRLLSPGCLRRPFAGLATILFILSGSGSGQALAQESGTPPPPPGTNGAINEIHFQYGNLKNPTFAGGGSTKTITVTWQHASRWEFFDSFWFVDARAPEGGEKDIYLEAYTSVGLGRLTGKSFSFGPIRDMGPRVAINWGAKTNIRKYLAGWRLSWDIPGFMVLNTDFYAFFDDSGGLASGGVPKQTDSWQVDLNWVYPIRWGAQRFSVEGHFEYTGQRRNELGARVARSLLGQPQFRFDLGNAMFRKPDKIFVGIELLIWLNKLGDAATDEARVQALVAWRF